MYRLVLNISYLQDVEYVCMHIYMYDIYMYVYVYIFNMYIIFEYVCMYIEYVCMYALHIHTYMHTYIFSLSLPPRPQYLLPARR